jgi:hypothetical protein
MDDDDASAWFNLGHAYEADRNFSHAGVRYQIHSMFDL